MTSFFTEKKLSEDIKRLKNELKLLRDEKCHRWLDLENVNKDLSTFRRRRDLYSHEKQALEFCKPKLSESAFKFFGRQQLHLNQPRWEYNSTFLLPLLMLQSNETRTVIQSLYKLPSEWSVFRIKRRLRKNPSALGNSPILTELVKRQRVEYRPPRPPRNKRRSVANSVSEYLEKFIQESET